MIRTAWSRPWKIWSAGKSSTTASIYRVLNRKGNSSWVNSSGSIYYSETGQVSYVLGELTFSATRPPQLQLQQPCTDQGNQTAAGSSEARLSAADWCGQPENHQHETWPLLRPTPCLSDVERILQDESSQHAAACHISGDLFALNLPGAAAGDVTSLFERVQERGIRSVHRLGGPAFPTPIFMWRTSTFCSSMQRLHWTAPRAAAKTS